MLRHVGADDGDGWGFVRCDYCDAEGPDPDNFPGHWNTRSVSAALALPEIAALVEAAGGLGAMPEGYCFCSRSRIGDDSKTHEPECADLRAALAAIEAAKGASNG